MRQAEISRETKETNITISFDPDGGSREILTALPFLDHMLESFGRHGGFGLFIAAKGDIQVDPHHTVEDIAIVLGMAIKEVIGDGRGITRFASVVVPMDEARAEVALDCGGRGYLVFEGSFVGSGTGGISNDLFEHFFYSLVHHAGITAHVLFTGRSDHHICESIFKAFGIALNLALTKSGNESEIRSTKGTF
ncbi:MAG: Imidazoleglycerol-phosphate dehydratase [Methanomicrobiales archaeon 53_19]|jgi:imidazoleglycerol-phosphate dehydratase|uniref:imidazoleglycerol-phosphate dehydratase HisB n=1 Tax=Methanocalculus sp. TaxID=2004547 RepID=UPI0007463763|nr:imidazoleglycerol-phosphate dehydratase HisB [Methanocalculus sp.]KUK69767.1 MAG: Imidazoleglycerol-phosphate dehydratase [Methanocalculus sp. 52_23]KUL04692.1 MAG: Imidazoleglycerol-phosphate dehydratase [Methanomicrobiales archaeon 53_19]HIJ06912.1 imidazoleglycerol-phosphate dehydratase HisB [Methanocalculus sp.]